jgi:excisionase family DNA binding protein
MVIIGRVGHTIANYTKLLTVDEAAFELGLKPKTIRKKIWRREIEYQKIGGAVRIRADVIAKIIEQSTVPALEAP